MTPDRVEIVNGKKVESFYWNGREVVYVDGKLVNMPFWLACDVIQKNLPLK